MEGVEYIMIHNTMLSKYINAWFLNVYNRYHHIFQYGVHRPSNWRIQQPKWLYFYRFILLFSWKYFFLLLWKLFTFLDLIIFLSIYLSFKLNTFPPSNTKNRFFFLYIKPQFCLFKHVLSNFCLFCKDHT